MKIYCSQDISHRQYCVIFSSGEYFREKHDLYCTLDNMSRTEC